MVILLEVMRNTIGFLECSRERAIYYVSFCLDASRRFSSVYAELLWFKLLLGFRYLSRKILGIVEWNKLFRLFEARTGSVIKCNR